MLSAAKLKELCEQRRMSVDELAGQLVRGGLNSKEAAAAVKNWQKGLFRPMPRKDDLIVGRSAQEAMDILKFTRKRAAAIVDKVLKSAVADADEQQADVDNLYVSEARVDDAGVRIGTKRWMPKDRGRAHPIRKKACHIYITVSEA
jgi:large subunit ribosomal protein L22